MSAVKNSAISWSPQQAAFIDWCMNGAGSCVLIAVAGAGKCLGKGTPVLKYNGDIVPVEAVVAGDLLMGPDSTPRRVLRTNKGSGPLRRIVPTKGDPWVCNDVHVMTLAGTNRKHGQTIDMPLDVYQAWVKRMPSTKMDWKLWRTGVDWLQSATEMDPYILGVWLGDGTRDEASITNPEPEIIEACRQYARQVGQAVSLLEERNFAENNLQRISFTNDHKVNPIRRYLRSLSGDRIPREYLINSREVRLQMLAGLIDTDGHNSNSGFEIITKYDQLAEDILFLVRSLGLAAYKTRKTGTIKSTGFSGEYWRIFISGDTNEVPLKVARKQAEVRQQIKRVNVTGFEIENLRKGTYYGFTLDGDGRFLLGDFTVTHNTTVLLAAGEQMRGQVAYVAYNKDIVEETKAKLKDRGIDWKKMQAGTAHSFGFSALKKLVGDVKVEGYKVANIVDAMITDDMVDGAGKLGVLTPFKSNVCQLVSLAKQGIFGIGNTFDANEDKWYEIADRHDIFNDEDRPPVERIIAFAQRVLRQSNEVTDIIDFDDMIYLPLLLKAPFWRFDVVMIDEAQDTNAARRALVRAMVKKGGRVIAVGDPCQPEGTQVSVPVYNTRWQRNEPQSVAIESLKKNDSVVSYNVADSSFSPNGRKVIGVTKRKFDGYLVHAKTPEVVSKYTPQHHCLVSLNGLRDRYAVYVMRRGDQYRVGKCKMDYAQASGPIARARAEKADALWILETHADENEAYFREQTLSAKFHVPQIVFNPLNQTRAVAAKVFDRIWSEIGCNENEADALLDSFGQNLRYPLIELSGYDSLKRPLVTRAANLIDGMLVLPYAGEVHVGRKNWMPVTVSRKRFTGNVVSLSVEGSKLYVADGIVTHNCQAIYGFAGADADALDLIKQDHNAIELPLTVSYRCPKAVVSFANKWVSHIEAAPTAPEGSVSSTTLDQFVLRNDLTKDAAVLSRTNAPIVELAFNLIRRQIPCRIEGRDIGKSIIKLMTRWKIKSLEQLEKKLADHFEKETTKLLAAKKEVQLARLEDAIKTIMVIVEQCRKDGKHQITDAVERVNALFGENVKDVLVLSSIHKAKGREWKRVFWLDRLGTCPSKWARQQWQQVQESNLCYVAATRAKEDLIEIVI